LAVIEDIIDDSCEGYKQAAAKLEDPVDRLRFYVTSTLLGLADRDPGASFITVEHWRLQTLYPEETSRATMPFTNLVLAEIRDATELGELHPHRPRNNSAWLVTQLTMAIFHHYDSAGLPEPADVIAKDSGRSVSAPLGGTNVSPRLRADAYEPPGRTSESGPRFRIVAGDKPRADSGP